MKNLIIPSNFKTTHNRMKNIHTLLSDAFIFAGLHKDDYDVCISDYYKVSIQRRNQSKQQANLNFFMGNNNTLYYFTESNKLFTPLEWHKFTSVIEREVLTISTDLQESTHLLHPLTENQTDTELNLLVGDFILNNYTHLNSPKKLIDLDEFIESSETAIEVNIYKSV